MAGIDPSGMRRMALTGTPGTGKSTVARILATDWSVEEVGDLAERLGTARRIGRRRAATRTIDLPETRKAIERGRARGAQLWVGHLAHLLPVRDAVVLRCHPQELARRLARSGAHRPADIRENLLAEATDVILVEALRFGRRVWEIDTTGRTPSDIASAVAARIRRRGPPSYGRIDWLADPWVTEHLLEWSR